MRTLPYAWDAFTPIALVSDNPVAVVSAKNTPWKDFNAAVEDIRKNPDKYFFGTSGPGSSPHVSMQALFSTLNLKIGHMPAKDSASAILALQAGTVQFYADPPVIIKHFDLKGMGIFADKRMDAFPDVPTFKELGINVPNFSGWHGFFAPAGLPADILAVLEAAAKKVILSPEFAVICKNADMAVSYRNSKEFKQFFSDQYAMYKKYITAFGLKRN
jgi:tripartite-type tricarboxylate transporter receptor subunit TctC